MPEPSNPTHRRDQDRPIGESDFEAVRIFADCGLHWAGFQSWFGRPLKEMKRHVFDAWPDLFRKIEVNDERETRKRAPRAK